MQQAKLTVFMIFAALAVISIFFAQDSTSHRLLKKKEIRVLKKVALASAVLGQRKKIMIPLPMPLPLPIPIIHKHEPIIAPIDPISQIKAYKGFGLGAIEGGFNGYGYGPYGRR